MTTMTTPMQLMVPTERDYEVGDHTGGEEGPGPAQTKIKDGRCRGKRRRWPCRCWRRGVRRGHEGTDRRRAVDRTMKQAIAEGKPWSRPGADEDRDEDTYECEEETEGP